MAWFGRRAATSFADDLAALQLSIFAAGAPREGGSFCVVGLQAGSGSTTIALGLAHTLSSGEQAVLLVDADRRAPRLHRVLGLPGGPGVTEVMNGSVGADEAILRSEKTGFSLLPCGASGRPATLFPSGWTDLFHKLQSPDSFMVVDAGDLGTPGAEIVAAACDSAILVIEEGAPWQAVESAAARLHRHQAKLRGVVLNKRRYPVPEFIYRAF